MEIPVEGDDNCCDNETEYVKAEQDLINYSLEINDTAPLDFLASFAVVFLEAPAPETTKLVTYTKYRPPILVYDRPVLFQTFLC